MNAREKEEFKEEVDAWIKNFKHDLDIFSGELDDYNDEVNNHREELQFNFENLCRLENKIDRIELLLEKVIDSVHINNVKNITSMQPLKDKAF